MTSWSFAFCQPRRIHLDGWELCDISWRQKIGNRLGGSASTLVLGSWWAGLVLLRPRSLQTMSCGRNRLTPVFRLLSGFAFVTILPRDQ